MSGLFGRLRELDAYTKPLDDFRVKTLTGGAVTLVSTLIMGLLFVGELQDFLKKETMEELFVDTSTGDDRLKINFDLTFPALACEFLSVDAMDVSGEQQADVQTNVFRDRLDLHGRKMSNVPEKHALEKPTKKTVDGGSTRKPNCGSCYGSQTHPDQCCNTCDEVKMAYRRRGWGIMELDQIEQCKNDAWLQNLKEKRHEGCRLYGEVHVGKVAGNFHIAPGKQIKEAHAHVHDLHSIGPGKFNTSHLITHLSFGESYPGKTYPLDGMTSLAPRGGAMFQYFVKIVPTTYEDSDEKEIVTHQFSVTKHQKVISLEQGGGLPGFFLNYEFSPLMVKLVEKRKPLAHFLTSVCAIIGGIFTVASLLDALIYRSSRVLQQKVELGKAY